jgi:iron complex transport system substrate-binding protein
LALNLKTHLAALRREFVQQFFPMVVARIRCAACRFALAATLAALVSATAAQAQPQTTAPAVGTAAANPAQNSTTREVTDETGRTIRVPQTIHRVVSLAPSITETLYALSVQDELVGDTDYCDYPPDAQHKPKVGGAINPSLEAIAALHPDLVLVTKALNRLDTVRALATLNIPSYATDPHTVAEILSSTQHLADLLGVPDSGAAITSDLQQRLESTQQRLSHFPSRRVLFVVWPQPLISIGRKTFIADALLYAGATSIIDSSQDWPQVSLEEVVHQQPEFLVFAESHSSEAPPGIDSLANLPGWRVLDAVKNRHFALVSDAVNRPALRIISAIESLAKQLHPEAYPEARGTQPDNWFPLKGPFLSQPVTALRSPKICLPGLKNTAIEQLSSTLESACSL